MMESKAIWMNGELVPFREAKLHFLTPALHYGVSAFEGIRCYRTVRGPAVFRLRDHDSSGCLSDQRIAAANGGNHRVDQSRDGVPICFVCHNATMGSGSTPWARDWAVASCATCHGSSQTPTTCR